MYKHWLLAIRPKTLSLAVAPVLVGTFMAVLDSGDLRWPVAVAALLAAVLIQAATNLHNDAADFERGADDPATRLGPPRASAEGWLDARQVKRAALGCFAAAFLLGMYLVWVGGWPILMIGVAAIGAGLAYTSGPRPIAYSALGEVFVFLFFGLAAVAGSYYLQVGLVSGLAVLAGAMLGFPAAAVLVVNNYRDLDNDREVGKITLAVRLGRAGSQVEYATLMLAPFLALAAWIVFIEGGGIWLALPFLILPRALVLMQRFRSELPGPVFNEILASTARFQIGFGGLLCIALLGQQGLLFQSA